MTTTTSVPPATRAASAGGVFERWVEYFRENGTRHAAIEALVNWQAPASISDRDRRAIVRSFQRFELGEGGDGDHLLAKVTDATQHEALRLLVREEQLHSALFRRGLEHLDAPTLDAHWSDGVFTALRRALGLRTELALFLTAEAVAMPYFVALARGGPDDVLRGIGTRIALDEEHHLAFQIDQLRVGFAGMSAPARVAVFTVWWTVAVGAATVVAVDHGAALRACGLSAGRFWGAALRLFRRSAAAALRRLAPADRDPRPGHAAGRDR